MSRRGVILTLPLMAALLVGTWLWLGGGMDHLALWAAEGQRDSQNAIARAVRAIRQGEAGALVGLLSVAFLYGVFHAAGPGHGKVLIGGYGFSRRVSALRLAGLALASSLAQSATAVLLVVAGIGLLAWTRTHVTGLADGLLSVASYFAIMGVGLWLVWRGARGLLRSMRAEAPAHEHAHHDHDHAHHDHTHHDEAHCHHCGHAHGPTPEEAERVRSFRDALILIGAVAIRPCTGALFLLIITWRMDILSAGIAGAFAMGLGTASVTIFAALVSVWLRQSSIERMQKALPDGQTAARLAAVTELAVGALIAFVAFGLAMRLL